jgi:MFS family permease
MLLGRFLVGTGMGLGPPVASLYITEVSPPAVRGTYGSFVQIATCLGIIVSLLIGTPVKDIDRWWRVCFWVAAIPATLQALGMEFCAESPQWLYKVHLLWVTAGSLCYASDLSSQTCICSPFITHIGGAVFSFLFRLKSLGYNIPCVCKP